MSDRGALGKGKKMKMDIEEVESVFMMREGPCPFQIDFVKKKALTIRKLMFSHMETKDIFIARLVSKDWFTLVTVEYRERTTNFPWIGRREEGLDMVVVLDEISAVKFLDVMTPSPLVPVQRIALRMDPMSIEPSTFIRLPSFIAPWVKVLRFCPWSSFDVDDTSPLEGENGTKALAWASAVDDFSGLQFPCLETVKVEETGIDSIHPSLATAMIMIVKKLLQGAKNLKAFEYKALFFEGVEDSMGAERQTTKVLTQALPPSVKRLGFGVHCAVDYELLITLNLQLEDFFGKGMPGEAGAFTKFLDGQKGSLRRLWLHDLDCGPDFPQLPLLTKLSMKDLEARSTLKCLQALPALRTLWIEMKAYNHSDRSPSHPHAAAAPTNFSPFPANPSVRNLTIRGFRSQNSISFALVAKILPNLTHVDFTCEETSLFTQLFTHLPHLQSLCLGFEHSINFKDLETVLSGIPPAICSLTKDYSVSDDTAFDAISVIASRDHSSTVGLSNLKDLRVLSLSDPSQQYKLILTKLFLHVVVRKMPKLEEIRLIGEVEKACDPILEAVEKRGVRVCRKMD